MNISRKISNALAGNKNRTYCSFNSLKAKFNKNSVCEQKQKTLLWSFYWMTHEVFIASIVNHRAVLMLHNIQCRNAGQTLIYTCAIKSSGKAISLKMRVLSSEAAHNIWKETTILNLAFRIFERCVISSSGGIGSNLTFQMISTTSLQ